jgi:hypothetical protein
MINITEISENRKEKLFQKNFVLLLLWVRVLCAIYKSSYNVSNTSYLDSILHHSLSSTPSPVPGKEN